MSELRDPLADAFFELRIQAPDEIEVPGSIAARRTVRNRRAIRATAAAAAVLAVAVIAGTAFGGHRGGNTAGPAPSPSANLSNEEQEKLGVEALAKFGYTPATARAGMLFGPVRPKSDAVTYGFGTESDPYPAGHYAVSMVCLGQGQVDVASETTGWSHRLSCDGQIAIGEMDVPASGIIKMTLRGDSTAASRSGIAVALTDRREVTARSLLPNRTGTLFAGSGFFDTGRMDVDGAGPYQGSFKLSVACVGAGTFKATITAGNAHGTQKFSCTQSGQLTSILVTPTKPVGSVTVQLEPDSDALFNAGYAYAVAKA